ncbi:phenylacetate-CoA ligase [Thermodesulfobium acidiphilum]|uniref:Phenylacetate-coenzyme A ligase n=1 Tax=Thermodesulfobium acidiphilum TaxID=1794699 RepID=A0A2R4W1U4_THEAF|nr:phenylacetate--CoA ligase [Thermodesulfobium acidiphilum]AWB10767.1 phenylacetate-CoA ligase [Thermodesulfobium acidiphilum]
MIFNPDYECMPRKRIKDLQLSRLRGILSRVWENVKFYRQKMEEKGLSLKDLRTLEDFSKFPFTAKQDLRDTYPFGLFAVPERDVVRLHASSGTTGRPTVVGYTAKDLETWAELTARVLYAGGLRHDDKVQNFLGYGLFTGGLGMHYGAEKIGATVIPTSVGNSERQINIMKDFGTTAIIGTPSYTLHLAEVMKDMGIKRDDLKLRVGFFGAEPWTEEIRKELESSLGIIATDNYGLSEIMGPGVAGECQLKVGMHIWEDHFLVEIVDPETLEPVEPGEVGELVITSLTKEALPIIRYRTRDITYLIEEPCGCGRTMARIGKIKGRTDDMLIIRGVNVFPSQIEEVLISTQGVLPHYQIVLDRKNHLDIIEVFVEVSDDIFQDKMRSLVEMERGLTHKLKSVLGIDIKLRLVEPKTIERSSGKAKRVIDKRKLNL